MNKKINRFGINVITLFLFAISTLSLAGESAVKADNKVEKKEYVKLSKDDYKNEAKKQELMREISFLAKKLLDMSGEDSILIKSAAVMKPFIGICSKIIKEGVELTCINPDSQAQKGGLKTGDVMLSVNNIGMASDQPSKEKDHPFWKIVNTMETGDTLKIVLSRGGEKLNYDVSVGAISHPAYELKVSNK